MNIFSKASAVSLGNFETFIPGKPYLTKVKSKWKDKRYPQGSFLSNKWRKQSKGKRLAKFLYQKF